MAKAFTEGDSTALSVLEVPKVHGRPWLCTSGRLSDIAQAILFFASDGLFVTRQILIVDAGCTMRWYEDEPSVGCGNKHSKYGYDAGPVEVRTCLHSSSLEAFSQAIIIPDVAVLYHPAPGLGVSCITSIASQKRRKRVRSPHLTKADSLRLCLFAWFNPKSLMILDVSSMDR